MILVDYLKQLHRDFKAAVAKHIRTQEITKVLSSAHIQELATTPGEQWALVKSRQAKEIQAVRDGKFDIVDRRSWQYPYLPEALHRLNQPILKNTPYNLRRFSETPVPRRAINLIKNTILSLDWVIEPTKENVRITPEMKKRIDIATDCLEHPNNVDSWWTMAEAVIEDIIVGGYGVMEPRLTPFYKRPFKLWAVDGSTIRIYADWSEGTPDRPHYAQMTGLKGERGIVAFLHDELIYIRDNVRTNTPFGLGKLEVAFNTVNAFLGVQDMAAKAGSDQVHKTWLWWEAPQNPAHVQTIRRHIQNELEGQAKVSLMAGMKKPEVIEVTPVTEQDLLLNWQQLLIRIIANAFDLSPFALGLERDVNRNTAGAMQESDFKNSVVPMAHRLEERITRDILHGLLGWKDLQFTFKGMDDPDAMTKVMIQQRLYMMDAVTTDEIREDNDKRPLPGGWGRLTSSQKMILQAEAGGMIKGGSSAGLGSSSSGTSLNPGSMMGIGAAGYSPNDILQMSPDYIQQLQESGLLPPSGELQDQMDTMQPGILEQLSDELREFFEMQDAEEEESQVQPQKISKGDERDQAQKFSDAEHRPTLMESILNDRGLYRWLPPGQQDAMRRARRGKYPRSGGRDGLYR